MLKRKDGTTNIVICGVGGQGIILASDVLCHAAFLDGFDVKKSEVHGMAQRGGSVITHVRFGEEICSPLIEEGTADFMLAFEKLEALRYAYYLKNGSEIIVDNREIPPMSVLVGQEAYPVDIDRKLAKAGKTHFVNAAQIALELGNMRVINIILLGVLSGFLNLRKESWEDSIRTNVKEKFVELNIKAFTKGRES
jgi:indolepyruvate ferredoxin oxidoreductase beta subunit